MLMSFLSDFSPAQPSCHYYASDIYDYAMLTPPADAALNRAIIDIDATPLRQLPDDAALPLLMMPLRATVITLPLYHARCRRFDDLMPFHTILILITLY